MAAAATVAPTCAPSTSISTAPCSARAVRSLTGADGGFSLDGVRALQACDRAGAEVVIYSGRRQGSVFENARVIGQASYIFELGCGLVLDGELEWLTDGLEPSLEAGYDLSADRGLRRPGAAARALRRPPRVPHPMVGGREVSHLFRGEADLAEVEQVLASAGLDWLRLVDNGVLAAHGVALDGPCSASRRSRPRLSPDSVRRVEGARGRAAHAEPRVRSRRGDRGRGLARGPGRGLGRRSLLDGRQRSRTRPSLGHELAGRDKVRVPRRPMARGSTRPSCQRSPNTDQATPRAPAVLGLACDRVLEFDGLREIAGADRHLAEAGRHLGGVRTADRTVECRDSGVEPQP